MFFYSQDLIQDNANYELLGKLFFELGYINAVQGEFKPARLKLNKSIQYFKLSNSANLAFNSAIYIGWSFHEECLYNNAIKYYNSFKVNIKDSLQKGVLWQEIAGNYYKLKQYDSAKYNLTNAPDIKEKELIWCCLHLLEIPTHDILVLLDYESINSLKGMKRRLAPKLGLENAALLNDYLLLILTTDW